MTKNRKKKRNNNNGWGGARENAGRPCLLGVPKVSKGVRVTPETIANLERVGEGNLSLGVEIVTRAYCDKGTIAVHSDCKDTIAEADCVPDGDAKTETTETTETECVTETTETPDGDGAESSADFSRQ